MLGMTGGSARAGYAPATVSYRLGAMDRHGWAIAMTRSLLKLLVAVGRSYAPRPDPPRIGLVIRDVTDVGVRAGGARA